MKRRIDLLREFSGPLLSGVAAALVWANVSPGSYHHWLHEPVIGSLTFHFISNDLFMVLFFGIAAVEITQSCLPGGDLFPLRKAINPLLSTLGGVLGPVLVYFAANALFGSMALMRGWGIPTATDIALAWLVARIVFGARHPAISFLLLLAIADDAIGLGIIAIFYPDPAAPVEAHWLLLTVVAMGLAYIMKLKRVMDYRPYVLIGGTMSWIGLFQAHLHPALALAFIVPFLPHPPREKKHMFEEDLGDRSPLSQFEHEWKVPVDFGLFLFGLANAGVALTTVGPVTWIVLAALALGKTAGIFGFGMLAQRLGYPLPAHVRAKELALVGLVAGIGLTVALFVAGEAFTDATVQGAAKMGALLSALCAIAAIAIGRAMKVKRMA